MKLFINQDLIQINKEQIRHIYVHTNDSFYFSVADTLGVVTNSSDSRNYWKVLKNRLKKEDFELVTKCNQLKLPSRDGKSYLTDTLCSSDLLEMIHTISPTHVSKFVDFFIDIEGKNSTDLLTHPLPLDALQNAEDDAELQIDLYQNQTHLFVRFVVAGLMLEDLHIQANYSAINISGQRIKHTMEIYDENIEEKNYHHTELYWGSFSRHIKLPIKIKYENFSAYEYKGVITLKFEKENIDSI